MEKVRSYKDLEIWKRSMSLVTDIYTLTKKFPDEEKYGLTSQLCRSGISVPSNIAEGSSRKSTKELIHFLYISNGSLSEIETQLMIAVNLGYTNNAITIFEEIKSIQLMIRSLIKKLSMKIAN